MSSNTALQALHCVFKYIFCQLPFFPYALSHNRFLTPVFVSYIFFMEKNGILQKKNHRRKWNLTKTLLHRGSLTQAYLYSNTVLCIQIPLASIHNCIFFSCRLIYTLLSPIRFYHPVCVRMRGGGLGSRPKKMYGERLGDGVEYHLMSPTPHY